MILRGLRECDKKPFAAVLHLNSKVPIPKFQLATNNRTEYSRAMKISTHQEKVFLILRVSGRMDGDSMPEFDRQCDTLIQAGNRQFILNLSGVDYVSSAGLRSLLRATRKLKSHGGTLVLCSLRSTVKVTLAIAG